MSQIREGAGGSARVCYYCALVELPSHLDPARKTELRPYGPGGAPVCFPCATRPENVAASARQLSEKLGAAWKEGDGVATLTKDGPKAGVPAEGGYGLAIDLRTVETKPQGKS